MQVPADPGLMFQYFVNRGWSDGLPMLPPTRAAIAEMIAVSGLEKEQVLGVIPPLNGIATMEKVAANAVMAGCLPDYFPLVVAAVKGVLQPGFNLDGVQTTTGNVAPLVIINGPCRNTLQINYSSNVLGQGWRANATIGRALRLVLSNIGGATPGLYDKATLGQPAKYTFCIAENEEENPWEPLHVERGFARDSSAVTVVGALGTWNMNIHAKDSGDLLRVIADTMTFPASSDFVYAGEPWLILSPEHAHILHRDGLAKAEVKRRLWEQARLAAHRLSAKDFGRTQSGRRADLGEITRDTLLTIASQPGNIGILVAGGPGTHSVYVPMSGHVRSVTRQIV